MMADAQEGGTEPLMPDDFVRVCLEHDLLASDSAKASIMSTVCVCVRVCPDGLAFACRACVCE